MKCSLSFDFMSWKCWGTTALCTVNLALHEFGLAHLHAPELRLERSEFVYLDGDSDLVLYLALNTYNSSV